MNAVIYAVRHGETEWNLVEKMQGHMDSPLTNNGIKQAQFVADGLASKKIDILFSSDLGRAIQTAEIIASRLSLEINTDMRLREHNLGIFESLTKTEFEERYPEEVKQFYTHDPDYVIPGGESMRQRFNRCIECAEEIVRGHEGKNILIIGHAGVLTSFFYKAVNLPLYEPRRFSVFNAGINAFSLNDGQWRLETWGEIAHLKDIRALDEQ
jgi:2,3-bisphosphoglycerate-dependent phosphoglycerate mutase